MHLARMVFIMENGLWRSENAHFFPLRRRVTASAFYHPHLYAQNIELHLSADPLEPCTRPEKSCSTGGSHEHAARLDHIHVVGTGRGLKRIKHTCNVQRAKLKYVAPGPRPAAADRGRTATGAGTAPAGQAELRSKKYGFTANTHNLKNLRNTHTRSNTNTVLPLSWWPRHAHGTRTDNILPTQSAEQQARSNAKDRPRDHGAAPCRVRSGYISKVELSESLSAHPERTLYLSAHFT